MSFLAAGMAHLPGAKARGWRSWFSWEAASVFVKPCGSGKWLSEGRTGLGRACLTDTALPPGGWLSRSSREPQSGRALTLRRGCWWWNRGAIPWWGGSCGKTSRLTGSTVGFPRSNKETSFTPLPQVLQQILILLGRKVEVRTVAWKAHVIRACFSGDAISSVPSTATWTSLLFLGQAGNCPASRPCTSRCPCPDCPDFLQLTTLASFGPLFKCHLLKMSLDYRPSPALLIPFPLPFSKHLSPSDTLHRLLVLCFFSIFPLIECELRDGRVLPICFLKFSCA